MSNSTQILADAIRHLVQVELANLADTITSSSPLSSHKRKAQELADDIQRPVVKKQALLPEWKLQMMQFIDQQGEEDTVLQIKRGTETWYWQPNKGDDWYIDDPDGYTIHVAPQPVRSLNPYDPKLEPSRLGGEESWIVTTFGSFLFPFHDGRGNVQLHYCDLPSKGFNGFYWTPEWLIVRRDDANDPVPFDSAWEYRDDRLRVIEFPNELDDSVWDQLAPFELQYLPDSAIHPTKRPNIPSTHLNFNVLPTSKPKKHADNLFLLDKIQELFHIPQNVALDYFPSLSRARKNYRSYPHNTLYHLVAHLFHWQTQEVFEIVYVLPPNDSSSNSC